MSIVNRYDDSSFKNKIIELSEELQAEGDVFTDNVTRCNVTHDKVYRNFIGSLGVVTFTSTKVASFKAPACLAGFQVNIVAKELRLGINQNEETPHSARIYAPVTLTISAEKIYIGKLEFVDRPQGGFIYCKNLFFQKTTKPEVKELVKSFLVNKETEIKVSGEGVEHE